MTTDPTSADTLHVWLKTPRSDGKLVWGWQATHEGRVIAFGESTSESHARRAVAVATHNHAQPLASPL